MSAKHTPKPWTSCRGVADTVAQAQAEHNCIQDANGFDIAATVGRDNDGEEHANAHLIAAAPDLLEACEDCLHQLGTDSDLEALSRPDKYVTLADVLRDAIAKAKGAA